MTSKPGHYGTLGVPRDADAGLIKKAYRKKAAAAHPDRGGSHTQMAEINHAFEVLGDAERRRQYDRTGEDKPKPSRQDLAQQYLRGLFTAYLDSDDDLTGNLVERFSGTVKQRIADLDAICAKATARIRKLERARSRMKGPSLFAEMADGKLVQQRQTIAKAEDEKHVHRRVLELLAEYKDDDPLLLSTLQFGGLPITTVLITRGFGPSNV